MCGIIGILGAQPTTELLFQGMLQLQHRGQDASGVFLYDSDFEAPILRKRAGWAFQLFQEEPSFPKARWGLGHIRYSTSGKGNIEDAQPLAVTKEDHTLAIVHNGNLVNYSLLRDELAEQQLHLQTNCDSEAILSLLSQHLCCENLSFDTLCHAVNIIYEKVIGAYSIIGLITGLGLFAFRDPQGIRPLLIGSGTHFKAIASETLSLSNIGCKAIEDVIPGELVFLDRSGTLYRRTLTEQSHHHCSFEFNYFAKTPTVIEGREIYTARSELGRLLAKKILNMNLFPIDVVIPIPDTGNPAGISLAKHLHIPFAEGFVRHHHAGRTFIIVGQEQRQAAAIQKLSPIASVFEGKTVLLVDDSIIRGTVSKRTITLARNAGAKKILFASTFPPVIHPCVYGIDFPCANQLIATNKSLLEICEEIGADHVIYNDVNALQIAIGLNDLCLACVTGCYPTSTAGMDHLQLQRQQDLIIEGQMSPRKV